MDKVQLYAEITSFNHSITNDRETKSSKFYYMQDSEAAEKALFVEYITQNYPLGKERFQNINTAIDLAFGSGNLCSKILIENDIVLKKLILNDKFSSDVNRNLKDAFESLYTGLECKVTDYDFFNSASFNEKADLLVFNPTSGGKPYSKDYNKNGKKEDLVQTIQNILTDESVVIFNGKRDEFNKLFSNLKCIFTYIPVNGNNEITIAYNNGSESFHKVFHNEGEIKELNSNESFYGKEVDLDTLEEAISLQIQKIRPPRNEKSIVSISEDPLVTDERIRSFAHFIETLPEDKKGSILEAIGTQHLTNEDINILLGRKKSLEIFRTELVNCSWDEPKWQSFFEENSWIFGYGLNYQYLQILQKEAHTSGVDLDGKNEVITDFLMGTTKFTVLVELKKPDTPLFGTRIERSESWRLSNDLNSAMSQILAQKAEWQIKSESENHDENGEVIKQKTFDPKTILVIGDSSQYNGDNKENRIKAKTFELFRRNSRNIEILTYDELFERAEFIVNQRIK